VCPNRPAWSSQDWPLSAWHFADDEVRGKRSPSLFERISSLKLTPADYRSIVGGSRLSSTIFQNSQTPGAPRSGRLLTSHNEIPRWHK
jgi:hypothetical protein